MKLKKLYWRDVKNDVAKANPEFAEIVNKINPPDSCFFYEAKYSYGASILHQGEFSLPSENGDTISFFDKSIPNEIQREIGYNFGSNPALMVLDHPVELFASVNKTIVPSHLFFPGDIFGLGSGIFGVPDFNSFEHPTVSIWDVTAGARSAFMLPKICDMLGHRRLEKDLGIQIEIPDELQDHWGAFKAISSKYEKSWATRLLFFPREWFVKLHTPEWAQLKIYLLQLFRKINSYYLKQFPINIAFSQIHYQKNLKPSLLVNEIIKHLFAVAARQIIGFQPAEDDLLLPAKSIQRAYVEIYQLKNYMPIVMQPVYFNSHGNTRPVYSSLHFLPIENAFELSNITNAIKLLDEVQYIFVKYLDFLKSSRINVDTPYLNEIAKSINFDFYHYQPSEKYPNIHDINRVIFEDKAFECPDFPKNSTFPHASKFFKGCIRIKAS